MSHIIRTWGDRYPTISSIKTYNSQAKMLVRTVQQVYRASRIIIGHGFMKLSDNLLHMISRTTSIVCLHN